MGRKGWLGLPHDEQRYAIQGTTAGRIAEEGGGERRPAELRAKRMRATVRYGAVAVIVVVVVVLIVVLTSSSNKGGAPTPKSAADVKTVPIPASLHLIADPATTPGDEGIPIAKGPKLATLATAATGQTVDGVQCQAGEQLVSHVHTHLTIFVNGKARVIPYGIGVPGYEAVKTPKGAFVETGSCLYSSNT